MHCLSNLIKAAVQIYELAIKDVYGYNNFVLPSNNVNFISKAKL